MTHLATMTLVAHQPGQLHNHALDYLTDRLISYGNEISEDHRAGLSGLCELAEALLTQQLIGRVRFALPCGMGKTTGVRSILKAISDLGMTYRVVVASSKIEELSRLYRTLVDEDNIPSAMIGLRHSAVHDPKRAAAGQAGFSSEPSHNESAQFLLVTHQNVKAGKTRPWMKDCDLVLFDESLVVSESQHLPLSSKGTHSLSRELGGLEEEAKAHEELKPAVEILREFIDALKCPMDTGPASQVRTTRADLLTQEEIGTCRRILASVRDGHSYIDRILEWAEQATEFRVYHDKQGTASLISYSITVPDELQQVIVLDASDPIRELVHYDVRMHRAEDVLPSLARFRDSLGGLASIKYHSHVQIHFANDPGSRSTMTNQFREQGTPWPVKKLVRLVRAKPDEGFLVVTYKQRETDQIDFRRKIETELRNSGVDPDEVVQSGVCRIRFLTWGHETGTNEFADYENVVLLGVMFQPRAALAGTYLGQVDNIQCPRMASVVNDLVYSECRHSIYQAINRIRVRKVVVVDGLTQAKPCSVYVWHHDARLEESLRPVLRGCPSWIPWREADEDDSGFDIAVRLKEVLVDLVNQGVYRISLQKLKPMVAPGATDGMWGRGRDLALGSSDGWIRKSATLIYPFVG